LYNSSEIRRRHDVCITLHSDLGDGESPKKKLHTLSLLSVAQNESKGNRVHLTLQGIKC